MTSFGQDFVAFMPVFCKWIIHGESLMLKRLARMRFCDPVVPRSLVQEMVGVFVAFFTAPHVVIMHFSAVRSRIRYG